jgi:Protein of unknown function (DUF1077)
VLGVLANEVALLLDSSLLEAFVPFAPSPASSKSLLVLPLPKLVYIMANLLTLALGLWKCRSMGLLPTGTGDWLAFESRGLVSILIALVTLEQKSELSSSSLLSCIFVKAAWVIFDGM